MAHGNNKKLKTRSRFGLVQMQQISDMRIQLHYYYHYFQRGGYGPHTMARERKRKRVFGFACSLSCQHLK